MHSEFLTESRWSPVTLNAQQIELLESCSRSLRTQQTISPTDGVPEDGEDSFAGVRWEREGTSGACRVQVANYVGVIGLGDVQLVVLPKIPSAHFSYIAYYALGLARTAPGDAELGNGLTFWDLVCNWFVRALEAALRLDHFRDYQTVSSVRSVPKGRIDVARTANLWIHGRAEVVSSFQDLTYDSPFNRMLLAACRAVSRSGVIQDSVRRRAANLVRAFGDAVTPSIGLSAVVEQHVVPRTSIHRAAWRLAKMVLEAQGQAIREGDLPGGTFLIYAPSIIEDGLRNMLADQFAGRFSIAKERRVVSGAQVSMNPDLVLRGRQAFHGHVATGDVKYRLATSTWHRPNLNQAIAFASVFDAKLGFILAFGDSAGESSDLGIDRRIYRQFLWQVSEDMAPESCHATLMEEIDAWIQGELLLPLGTTQL